MFLKIFFSSPKGPPKCTYIKNPLYIISEKRTVKITESKTKNSKYNTRIICVKFGNNSSSIFKDKLNMQS